MEIRENTKNENEKMVIFGEKFEKNFRRLAFFLSYTYRREFLKSHSKMKQALPEMKGPDGRKGRFGMGDGLVRFLKLYA